MLLVCMMGSIHILMSNWGNGLGDVRSTTDTIILHIVNRCDLLFDISV